MDDIAPGHMYVDRRADPADMAAVGVLLLEGLKG